ncbi:MAG: malonate decarboxylase subunit delta [Burkholderiales bacterium]|nr:malonate decarboxylase subunit delta [Burkholderiales bacterium]
METLTFDYPAGHRARSRALVGVVASGDLEVLLEPADDARTIVRVTTSVDGMAGVWAAVLERIFGTGTLPAARLEINDFGATPGVVRMRVGQVLDMIAADDTGARQ